MVNVLTEIRINRSIEEVASFSANPSNAPIWYDNIHSAERKANKKDLVKLKGILERAIV